MASVRGDVRLNDYMSRSLNLMNQALKMTVNEMNNLSKATGSKVDTTGLDKIASKLIKIDTEISSAVEEQENLNKKVKETTAGYTGLGNVIKTAIGALGIKKLVDLSDTNTQVTARLKIMSGGSDEQVAALQDQIYASAQRSRADYFATADVVSKLGMRAKGTFGNTNEIIQFSENLNKMFVIAGASQAEMSSASLQLTQALGSGVLRGEELNAVFEAAPNIVQTIADYMDVPIGKIRELASEGKITSEVIKNAMLNEETINKINSEFDNMPMTWGQVWTMTVNKIIQISQPLLNFISLLADNWSTIEPIVLGVATAVGLYAGALLLFNVQQGISNGLKTLGVISAVAHGAAITAEMTATTGMTAAQIGFNAALYACPLTWIVIAVIAIIAIIYAVVAAINKVKGTTISATGVIMGAVYTVGAFLWNTVLGLIDLILGAVNYIANPWIAFANFFGNLFNDPIGSIIHLFGDLADNVLGVVETIAKAIDKVFGTNLAGTVQEWRSGLNSMVETAANKYGNGSYEKVMDNLDLSSESLGLSRWEYGDAWNKGYAMGENIDSKVSGLFNGELGEGLDIGNVANVENVEGEVNVASEDLKLLRELAEQQYIQNYISNAPVQYITTGDIHENADIDYLIDGVRENLSEAINTSMEGVPVG
ncbi:MAG: tape measure protein [Clostridia bacterium]|nr:tape measure protein [Clostridia bacterium]